MTLTANAPGHPSLELTPVSRKMLMAGVLAMLVQTCVACADADGSCSYTESSAETLSISGSFGALRIDEQFGTSTGPELPKKELTLINRLGDDYHALVAADDGFLVTLEFRRVRESGTYAIGPNEAVSITHTSVGQADDGELVLLREGEAFFTAEYTATFDGTESEGQFRRGFVVNVGGSV